MQLKFNLQGVLAETCRLAVIQAFEWNDKAGMLGIVISKKQRSIDTAVEQRRNRISELKHSSKRRHFPIWKSFVVSKVDIKGKGMKLAL